jgi:hypothetical protein
MEILRAVCPDRNLKGWRIPHLLSASYCRRMPLAGAGFETEALGLKPLLSLEVCNPAKCLKKSPISVRGKWRRNPRLVVLLAGTCNRR